MKIFRQTSSSGKQYWTFTTFAQKLVNEQWVRDEESKMKWYVKFAKCVQPLAQKGYSNNREYEYADINIDQFILGNTEMYNGTMNPTITILAYTEVKQKEEPKESLAERVEEFRKDNGIDISTDNLPFY